ncbi:hypothetical protein M9M90_00880 [Phenylobacterium sp. LH3H17]|uniref:RHS repeat domain-containing protein n=1 Tax=Phenylobacterium sp. LH3H17 TaxID=2903901 RepID=UPI0020C9949B|nr:RHS repeat-associated core domain-containing protein [Phenylobacterium sp. LH3H17]UTP39762.1 hypothetical protein M9M90_00880 [Phenylobacterium sp. LH3H17]
MATVAHGAASTKIGTASLITPTAANTYFGSATTSTNSTGAVGRPKEIVELARALKGDPDLIYEHVRNNTTTVWTYGLTKGAMGVIVDRAATAFDQAHLMVELLRESGFTAEYKVGTITLSATQFSDWTGITSATAACQLLSSGGIAAVINGTTTANCAYGAASVTTVQMSHVWTYVTIQGVGYFFDPSYKPHTFKTGIDLAAATGLTTGQVMSVTGYSGTQSGVSFGHTYDNATVKSTVAGYAAAIETSLAANAPAAGLSDVVGGQSITPATLPVGGLRQLALPYTHNTQRTYGAGVPNQYRTKVQVQITKVRPDTTTPTIVDKLLYADDIYGRRLVFDTNFDTTGATFTSALKLVDDLGATINLVTPSAYSDNPTFSRGTLTLTLNAPYAANSGAYMDTVFSRAVNYALPLTIVDGFGDAGSGLVDKWGSRRDTVMPAVGDTGCKACFVKYKAWKGDGRRELLAASWLAQSSKAARIHAAIAKSIYAHHYSIGVSSADTTVIQTPNGSYWVADSFDRLDVETGLSLTSRTAVALDRRAALHATAATLAALKGSVSAQVSDLPDTTSTAARFEWGNAPESGTDPAGGTVRKFFQYVNSTEASQALGLSKTEGMTSTADDGVHGDGATPEIGSAEVLARRQAVADAVSAYVTAGFTVIASEEAFLGPGERAAGFTFVTGATYSHAQSSQRGGALTASKYDGNGDPIEIANLVINPNGALDAGGGGAQMHHQTQYDPATSADVVKGRFVDTPVGSITAVSPASVTSGVGAFPYSLSGQLIWRGGEVRDDTYGSLNHREPQGGWTTNWDNNLTLSGSGLEAMSDTDARASVGTVAAFYAAQDVYKSSASIKREVIGQLVNAWWVRELANNVATVSLGTGTKQFLRRANGQWFAPGPGAYSTLVQTGARSVLPRHPSNYCGSSAMLSYVPTRGWTYAGMSFARTGPQGDVQTYQFWNAEIRDAGATICGEQHGFRLSTWAWPRGVTLSFNYTNATQTELSRLSYINNDTYSLRLEFANGGVDGFDNGLTNQNERIVSVTQPAGPLVQHTDPIGAVTKFEISTLGTGDYARQRLEKIYPADTPSAPAVQYVYDTLARAKESRDKLVLAGSRASTQFLLANGLRSEIIDALGYGSITYADLDGRPVRAINALGAASVTTYDGRGRTLTATGPEGDKVEFEYNARNQPTKQIVRAKPGSAEAGQSITAETSWNPTWNAPDWTKDAKGAQTDYTYSQGQLQYVSYPEPQPGEQRPGRSAYYYPGGLTMSVTNTASASTSMTYSGVSFDSVTKQSAFYDIGPSPEGDPATLVSPRGAISNITYDLVRRPILRIEPQVGTAPRVATRTTYDLVGRVTKVERGSFSGTTFTPIETATAEYDAIGNKVKDVTPAGVTQYSYDALNRVVCTAVRMNPAVYGALPTSACIASTPGVYGPDRIVRATYDAVGQVVQSEQGVGTSVQQVTARYTYSPNGQNTTLTDGNGNTSTFEYDGFGRLKKLRYPADPRGSGLSSTSDYEAYTWDVNGNRTSWRKRDGKVLNYTYDALNRLLVKDLPDTTADDVYYTYDYNGRLTQARFGSLSNPPALTQGFDALDRVVSEDNGGGRQIATQYDVEGNRTKVNFEGTSVANPYGGRYVYDVANRLTEVHLSRGVYGYANWTNYPIATIGYGPLNRRASITRPNGVRTDYSFDGVGWLSGLSHVGAPASAGSYQTFAYNPAGQMIDQAQGSSRYVWSGQPTTTTNFTHDALNRDAAMAAAAGYDANGNLISDGVRTFAYDAENRLISVTGGSAPLTLSYDPLGRLLKTTSAGASTTFNYAGSQLVAEVNPATSTLLRSYIHGDRTDEPMAWMEGANPDTDIRFLHPDRLGSIIAVSNAGGAITSYTYGPYGEPQSWAGSRFRYTGQTVLPEAQLYHYKARVYDPMMGRFLQTDPIGYGDGPNTYAYVGGDPVNDSDPSGLLKQAGRTDSNTVEELIVQAMRRVVERRADPGGGGPASTVSFVSSATLKEQITELEELIVVARKKAVEKYKKAQENAAGPCVVVRGEVSFGNQLAAKFKSAYGQIGAKLDAGTFRLGYVTGRGGYLKVTQGVSGTLEAGNKEASIGGEAGVQREGAVGMHVPPERKMANQPFRPAGEATAVLGVSAATILGFQFDVGGNLASCLDD